MTQKNGSIVWRAEYAAFGEAEETNTTFRNPLRFPGQYYDEESGPHYNFFRDYDPSLGRYIQSDPIGSELGFNRYGYADQNPVNYIDPQGDNPVVVVIIVINKIIDFVDCMEDCKEKVDKINWKSAKLCLAEVKVHCQMYDYPLKNQRNRRP